MEFILLFSLNGVNFPQKLRNHITVHQVQTEAHPECRPSLCIHYVNYDNHSAGNTHVQHADEHSASVADGLAVLLHEKYGLSRANLMFQSQTATNTRTGMIGGGGAGEEASC